MENHIVEQPENVVPARADILLAIAASQALVRSNDSPIRIRAGEGPDVRLPDCAATLLRQLLAEMARGNALALVPTHATLTTQQAADCLNVSRPYLVGLLEKGDIPFHRVGTHRRVKLDDLLAYKKRFQEVSDAAMDELVAQAQELGLGY